VNRAHARNWVFQGNQESVNPHEKGQTNVRIPVREYVVIGANSIARDILSRSSLGALHSQQEEFTLQPRWEACE